jgi:CheY-like chemotaxis protein
MRDASISRFRYTVMIQAGSDSATGFNILVVEDCPDQQRLMVRMLEKAGCRVTLECNGQAGMERVLRDRDPFDLIVMDFAMPLSDGMQATRILRDAGSKIPIIAMTAHHSEQLEMMWRMVGCDAYFNKPVDFGQLQKAICELVGDGRAAETLSILNR